MSEVKFDCKREEIIPISELAWQSIVRDKASFTVFSPIYNELFFTNIDKAIKDLKLLIHPQVMEAEGKDMTQKVNKMMDNFRPFLNTLESYVNKAEGMLNVAPSDFGFTGIREAISAHNKEGVIESVGVLLQLVNKNLAAIQAQGYTEDAKTALEDALEALESESLQRGKHVQDTTKGIKKYNKELNSLLKQIMTVCKDGKIIFATTEPAKVKDYTFTQLLKLVRDTGGSKPPDKK